MYTNALKENEACWIAHDTLLYKKDSRFDFYCNNKKLTGKSFTFKLEGDPIEYVSKTDKNITGYMFNGLQISIEDKARIMKSLSKYVRTINVEKEFIPIFAIAASERILSLDDMTIVGTKYNKSLSYIENIIDTSNGTKFNSDPIIKFNILDYIDFKFKNDIKNRFLHNKFNTIIMKSSLLESLEKEIYILIDNIIEQSSMKVEFTRADMINLANYTSNHDYEDWYEFPETFLNMWLIEKRIQTENVCAIIISILKRYEMSYENVK